MFTYTKTKFGYFIDRAHIAFVLIGTIMSIVVSGRGIENDVSNIELFNVVWFLIGAVLAYKTVSMIIKLTKDELLK